MTIIGYILLVVGAYIFMEFMAWFTHKYVMHGILWSWHEDHHLPEHEKHGFFERNDRFFLVFAVPSATCFIAGTLVEGYFFLVFIGLGILLYGATYFLIHDVYIHRRFRWFKHLDNDYSRAVLKAHGEHHAKTTKEDCESFGLLVVHPKFFKNRGKEKDKELEKA